MTPERWDHTRAYLADVFGSQDDQLATLMERAVSYGLPDIAITPDVGRVLMLLAQLAPNPGRRLALELGTLAGYSGIWLARGLGPGSRLVTVEAEPRHAEFARREFDRAGVGDRVQIRVGKALDVVPTLGLEKGSVDLVFLDALKHEYPAYFSLVRPLIRSGGLLIADNALGGGRWWIDDPAGVSPDRDGADALNRIVASDPEFVAACVPIREGVLIARRL